MAMNTKFLYPENETCADGMRPLQSKTGLLRYKRATLGENHSRS